MKPIAVVFLLLLAAPASHASDKFKVIVHPDLNVTSLTQPVVAGVFLKRLERWSNGMLIKPVDQSSGAVRDDFSLAILGKSANSVKQYWTQQIYSGHVLPPIQKRSDAEVIDFVRSTPGAIGYVSESAATDGVRVVAISRAP